MRLVLTHYVGDELFKTGCVLLFILLLQVDLGLPEVDAECLVGESEAVGPVEHLDASLGGLDVLIEDETIVVVREALPVDLLDVLLQFHGQDFTGLRELLLELLLADFLGDEPHEDV
jgi:hypothetical protein